MGFDYWRDKYVAEAEQPEEWTYARLLYENYLKRAKDCGNNRGDKLLSMAELATETRWGMMMGSPFPNKRRPGLGYLYPVRLKRCA